MHGRNANNYFSSYLNYEQLNITLLILEHKNILGHIIETLDNCIIFVLINSNNTAYTIAYLGYSDPYCMLGIIPACRPLHPPQVRDRLDSSGAASSDEDGYLKTRKEGALKRFQHSFKKSRKEKTTVRDMIPARFIRTTSVQNKTLNPVWNEKFLL